MKKIIAILLIVLVDKRATVINNIKSFHAMHWI